MSANFPDPMEQLRKQQEQIRRQQEMARQQQEQLHRQQQDQIKRQQQMAAWMSEKEASRQADPGDPFSRVEGEVVRLRAERDAGRLSTAEFEARLKELMVQDTSGAWWMLGADSGTWYRHDGTNWVQAHPSRTIPQPVQAPGSRQAYSHPPMRRAGRPGLAVLFFILGMAGVLILGYLASLLIPTMFRPSEAWGPSEDIWDMVCAGGAWLAGLIIILIIAIRIGRGPRR